MTNRKNLLHKRHQHNLNNIKKILQNSDATAVKADKSKAIVIIKTDTLNKKVDTFIKDNNMKQINKDPTGKYKKNNPTNTTQKQPLNRKTKPEISDEYKTNGTEA